MTVQSTDYYSRVIDEIIYTLEPNPKSGDGTFPAKQAKTVGKLWEQQGYKFAVVKPEEIWPEPDNETKEEIEENTGLPWRPNYWEGVFLYIAKGQRVGIERKPIPAPKEDDK